MFLSYYRIFTLNFSRVNEGLDEYHRISYLVASLIKQAQSALSEIYDDYTMTEWIEQKIYPLYKDLSDFKVRAESLKQRSVWPRRPLPILKAVQDLLQTSTTTTTENPNVQQQLYNDQDTNSNTVRPKRLVQAPDYYRHPPGSFGAS